MGPVLLLLLLPLGVLCDSRGRQRVLRPKGIDSLSGPLSCQRRRCVRQPDAPSQATQGRGAIENGIAASFSLS